MTTRRTAPPQPPFKHEAHSLLSPKKGGPSVPSRKQLSPGQVKERPPPMAKRPSMISRQGGAAQAAPPRGVCGSVCVCLLYWVSLMGIGCPADVWRKFCRQIVAGYLATGVGVVFAKLQSPALISTGFCVCFATCDLLFCRFVFSDAWHGFPYRGVGAARV